MRYEERDDDEVVDDDDDDNDDGLPTRTIHATKNLRIRGVHVRSALARKHYQSGPVDKPPLPKKAPADSGKRVVAEWSAIAGATMFETNIAGRSSGPGTAANPRANGSRGSRQREGERQRVRSTLSQHTKLTNHVPTTIPTRVTTPHRYRYYCTQNCI